MAVAVAVAVAGKKRRELNRQGAKVAKGKDKEGRNHRGLSLAWCVKRRRGRYKWNRSGTKCDHITFTSWLSTNLTESPTGLVICGAFIP